MGKRLLSLAPAIADFRGTGDKFKIEPDADTVRFEFEPFGKRPAQFDKVQSMSPKLF